MDIIESIYSWKRRALDPLENFQNVVPVDLVAEVQSAFMNDEVLLGIYFNSETDLNANLVFTTRGIYHFIEVWRCVEYAELSAARIMMRGENVKKDTADTLIVSYENGEERSLIVSGAFPGRNEDFLTFTRCIVFCAGSFANLTPRLFLQSELRCKAQSLP